MRQKQFIMFVVLKTHTNLKLEGSRHFLCRILFIGKNQLAFQQIFDD